MLPSGLDRDDAARLTLGLLAQLKDSSTDGVRPIPPSDAPSLSAPDVSDPSEAKPGVIAA